MRRQLLTLIATADKHKPKPSSSSSSRFPITPRKPKSSSASSLSALSPAVANSPLPLSPTAHFNKRARAGSGSGGFNSGGGRLPVVIVPARDLLAELAAGERAEGTSVVIPSSQTYGSLLRFIVLDVRPKDQFQAGHLPTAVHLDKSILRSRDVAKAVEKLFGGLRGCHLILIGMQVYIYSSSHLTTAVEPLRVMWIWLLRVVADGPTPFSLFLSLNEILHPPDVSCITTLFMFFPFVYYPCYASGDSTFTPRKSSKSRQNSQQNLASLTNNSSNNPSSPSLLTPSKQSSTSITSATGEATLTNNRNDPRDPSAASPTGPAQDTAQEIVSGPAGDKDKPKETSPAGDKDKESKETSAGSARKREKKKGSYHPSEVCVRFMKVFLQLGFPYVSVCKEGYSECHNLMLAAQAEAKSKENASAFPVLIDHNPALCLVCRTNRGQFFVVHLFICSSFLFFLCLDVDVCC